jgi:NAD(P)-dependent dehydrogenase (short-subunit alcohol dehydrogenase family)
MKIEGKITVVTGAAGGIGKEVSWELARRGASQVAMVDQSGAVMESASMINADLARPVAIPYSGDVTQEAFRQFVYSELRREHGNASICVPAAGITRDELAVRRDKQSGKIVVYPIEKFRQVTEVNLIAPVYWALEMVAGIADDRARTGKGKWGPAEHIQGVVIFIGSVSSLGSRGQISYAATKAGLEGAAATLSMEAIFHGVRCSVIHPGYTNTPMVHALSDQFLQENIIPRTSLKRLIEPSEIADAICFLIGNSAVSGSLWADAGYRPAV